MAHVPHPKIELHVHLEGAVRAPVLLDIARRNDLALPATDEAGLARLMEFRDFDHFIEMWIHTTNVIRTDRDFREIVVAYAQEAATHGCVYIEGIFSPAERVLTGASWDEVFAGFCDGAQEALEATGVEIRLTPDIPRGFPLDAAFDTARYAVKYRDRGIVGLGLGGLEAQFPPEPYADAFALARDGGLGAVPHAGEVAGVESIRGALDTLHADRLRHGIRAVEDPALLRELADRGIVCDVTPLSNVRTRAVGELGKHPLTAMLAAGVPCSISTDDPAMFDTDLTRDHDAAMQLGHTPRGAFDAGILGALCDDTLRDRLRTIGTDHNWDHP